MGRNRTSSRAGTARPGRLAPLVCLFWALGAAGGLPAQSDKAAPEKLTVDQAVAEAVNSNLDLLAERSNIAISKARILAARLRPNPALSLTADHLDLLGTDFNPENGAGPAEYAAGVEYTLEGGGKRKRRIREAEAAVSVAQLEFLNAVRTTILEVQSAFVDALLARDNLALAKKNLDSQAKIVEIDTIRLRTGDIAEVELIRSRLAALQYQNTYRLARMRFRNRLVDLQKLLGRKQPNPAFTIAGELRKDKKIPDLDTIRKLALERRPDLRALRSELKHAEADLDLQFAQGKIDYTVGAEYRRQQGINGTGNSLGFSFSIPLPVSDRNQGEIERARQQQQQIRLRIAAQAASITSEVENSYETLLTAHDLLQAIETEMVTQALDVRNITEYSYKRGEASILQLLDAQRAFNETMQSYNEARAEYARALYYIESVTGEAVKP